jgi:hypothetical protein
MPDHPMIRWETDGGALLPVDRNVRTRDPGYAGDPRYADTQRKNNVDGEHVKDSKAGNCPGVRASSSGRESSLPGRL